MLVRILLIPILFCVSLPIRSQAPSSCDPKNVCTWIETTENENAVFIQAKSLPEGTHMTVHTSVEGSEAETIPPTPFSVVLEGPEIRKLLVLRRKEGADPSGSIRILTVSYFGKLKAEHDSTYTYTLPYEGKSWISTGYNSGNDHRGDAAYSLDFTLAEGTPLLAARNGTVVETEDKYTLGEKDPSLIDKANRIVIEHPDGTVAIYGHLKPQGVLVKRGDKVIAGQRIGFSGNTGYSSGPHLHFEVYRPEENRRKTSFATPFLTEAGESEFLTEENAYWSPEQERFPGFPITNVNGICIGSNEPKEDRTSVCVPKIRTKRPFYLTLPIYKSGPYVFQADFIGPAGGKPILTLKDKIPAGITSIVWRIPPQSKSGKYKIRFQLEEKEIGERDFQILP
ncbi:M23 family metallopeptidase [Leptospira wolffii]|uniref:M23 family metallopeptidase n=1 Tax=Leptospira wolffii TaxID=409998 RepID=UPI00031DBC8A|nr:M23 family metallopeptidase [Leptospira wolffii]EPG64804.1 peptidase, M23 family [Leptospira wolffii serovar Khorat str. Khorat-H2]